ncbi:hydroxyproline dehydrogenase [Lepisosteus oculatus]|uniref:hydroxyproline dehydrogenase n=1 Tax=Lepisosteus oculatus TaxID=7918 RepID=UPI00371BD920
MFLSRSCVRHLLPIWNPAARTTTPRMLSGDPTMTSRPSDLPVTHPQPGCDPPVTLSFDDPRAFQVKSLGELLRALGVFRACSIPPLVNNCSKLLSLSRSVLGARLFSRLMRATVYAQFVAGETEAEIRAAMAKLSMLGMRPMLAVPIEEDVGETRPGEGRYDDNLAAMLECIRISHGNPWSADPMMQLKVTALLSAELCTKISSLLADSEEQFDLSTLLRAMGGQTVSFPGLTDRETQHFLCGLRRLNAVGERARALRVRVLVDAEYTYMNPALSLVTMAMMKKFNQSEAWIWNTYQCYLRDCLSLLSRDVALSVRESFCFGVKLVRGAYMDKERLLANQSGRPDPVHQSWESTNRSYDRCLDTMLALVSQHAERYRIIVATHNEESVKRAVRRMTELGISKVSGSVCFGQLLGMCDHVSLTLGQLGYPVYKSVPYGSVDDTVPYLVRRAQENRTVLQGIRKERGLLRRELWRRVMRR